MTTTVQDNREQQRFEVHVDGTLAGFAAYRLGDDTVTFTHTEIDDEYEGQGLGSELASAALDATRSTSSWSPRTAARRTGSDPQRPSPIRRSNPPGAWTLRNRTSVVPWLAIAWRVPAGTST